MARADFRFSYRKRVRYSEIDAQAVLFNARYLDYADIASTEYFRAIGLPQAGNGSGEVEFHTARAAIDYRRPILLDEEVDLWFRATRIGTSSLGLALEIHGADADDLRAEGELVYVHVVEARGRPTPIPDCVVALIEAYEGRGLRR